MPASDSRTTFYGYRNKDKIALIELALPWIKLALCSALIGMAGPALVRNGDRIAELTGLSRSWIGLILLATAPSIQAG